MGLAALCGLPLGHIFTVKTLPDHPLAIAFSGGGDSTALVHMLRDHRPAPLILIVDHALRAGSRAEALAAQSFAHSFGLNTEILTWTHDDPSTGLQEKARNARYALLGQVCRSAGIKSLLTAHTRDDQAETLLMRTARGTDWRGAAGMSDEVYAPVWPELANVTLLRPLMEYSRQELRAYNAEHNLTWSEDPSNENRVFSRIQARDTLEGDLKKTEALLQAARINRTRLDEERGRFSEFYKAHVSVNAVGLMTLHRPAPTALLKIFLRAASGSGGPIDNGKAEALAAAMKRADFKSMTLAGAMVMKRKDGWVIGRDPVAAKGRHDQPPLQPFALERANITLWDGRFQVKARSSGWTLGTARSCPHKITNMPTEIPYVFKDGLPAIWTADGMAKILTGSDPDSDVFYTCLVAPRLHRLLSPGLTSE